MPRRTGEQRGHRGGHGRGAGYKPVHLTQQHQRGKGKKSAQHLRPQHKPDTHGLSHGKQEHPQKGGIALDILPLVKDNSLSCGEMLGITHRDVGIIQRPRAPMQPFGTPMKHGRMAFNYVDRQNNQRNKQRPTVNSLFLFHGCRTSTPSYTQGETRH